MSFTTALYESDGVIRFAPRAPRVRAAVKSQGKTPGQGTKRAAQPLAALGKRRTRHGAIAKGGMLVMGAIWNALRSTVLWIDEKSREGHYRQIESYLAQSTDHADLERRLRDLERSNRLNWIDCGSR